MPEDAFRKRALSAQVELSPLTFGTMRLDRAGDVKDAARLIRQALELGVTTFHASAEYATWPLFVEAWREARPAAEIQLVAKVGAPHFGETAFVPKEFRAKIDGYRGSLGLEQLDVVQWLLRHDLQQEAERQEIFDRDAEVICETVDDLKRDGVIKSLVSFPYTRQIAERALAAPWCSGLALYCSPLELELVDLFDSALAQDKAILAIRPFSAGRVFLETSMTAASAVAFPLSHPAVASVITSVSSAERLREAATTARGVRPDGDAWASVLQSAREAVHV